MVCSPPPPPPPLILSVCGSVSNQPAAPSVSETHQEKGTLCGIGGGGARPAGAALRSGTTPAPRDGASPPCGVLLRPGCARSCRCLLIRSVEHRKQTRDRRGEEGGRKRSD